MVCMQTARRPDHDWNGKVHVAFIYCFDTVGRRTVPSVWRSALSVNTVAMRFFMVTSCDLRDAPYMGAFEGALAFGEKAR